MSTNKIELRMTIDGRLAQRLNVIKNYYQIKSYTEVIRFIITTKFEEIEKSGLT
jgi:hypothetical protein